MTLRDDPMEPVTGRTSPLRVLHLEDDPHDAELVRAAFAVGGISVEIMCVPNRAAYHSALTETVPDLILSDYQLPDFDGLSALTLAQELHPDIPFIFVSGTIGEERAIDAARGGANHFVLKTRLFRLAGVVNAALREGATISARRKAERALLETEAVTVQLMDVAPDAILIQTEGRICYANNALIRLLGTKSAGALLERPVLELIHPDDRPTGEAGQGQLLDMHQGLTPHHRRLQLMDGTRVEVEISAVPTAFKGHTAMLVVIHNISERQLREERVRQAQKMEAIGRLAGGVAHDFNNLLTVINGYAEMLLAARASNDPDRVPLEEIKAAGERAAALTRQLLAFSHRQVVHPRRIDLNQSVRDMESLLRRLIGEGIELSLSLSAEPVYTLIDPGQLEQVIMNLAVNARDAITHHGRITLATGTARELPRDLRGDAAPSPLGWALLTVTDTGGGMAPEVIRHILEPFFTTKVQGVGTGLGLATVDAIVQGAGGQIEIQSEIGRGTAFTVHLPAALAETVEPEAVAAQVVRVESVRNTPATIVLAEDESSLRELAEKILTRGRYKVFAAGDGWSALRLLNQLSVPVDLLLTDVVMPGMNGPELAKQARQVRPKLRILFMSGYNDETMLQHGLADFATGFVQKPFTPQQLLDAVASILSPKG